MIENIDSENAKTET